MVAGLFKHSPAIRVRGIRRHPPFTSLLREERRNFPTFTQIRTETHETPRCATVTLQKAKNNFPFCIEIHLIFNFNSKNLFLVWQCNCFETKTCLNRLTTNVFTIRPFCSAINFIIILRNFNR